MSFGEKKWEENVHILIIMGLDCFVVRSYLERWPNAYPGVPSILWHVISRPRLSVPGLHLLGHCLRQLIAVKTSLLSSSPPRNMWKGSVWGARAPKVTLGGLGWKCVLLLSGRQYCVAFPIQGQSFLREMANECERTGELLNFWYLIMLLSM